MSKNLAVKSGDGNFPQKTGKVAEIQVLEIRPMPQKISNGQMWLTIGVLLFAVLYLAWPRGAVEVETTACQKKAEENLATRYLVVEKFQKAGMGFSAEDVAHDAISAYRHDLESCLN